MIRASHEGDEVCQSILDVVADTSFCQPLGDCTGITCDSDQLNSTGLVVVDKCTDPLEVNITVYNSFGAVVQSQIVTETGDIAGTGYKVNTFTRTLAAMTISVSISRLSAFQNYSQVTVFKFVFSCVSIRTH